MKNIRNNFCGTAHQVEQDILLNAETAKPETKKPPKMGTSCIISSTCLIDIKATFDIDLDLKSSTLLALVPLLGLY